ncbi:MAG: rhomboid family intramembrane serine protease [Polyangiaceae bacterium]|nr:rhomboid family intramembrane serine protease [Polyangiaceae bacterium]
MFPLRDTIPSSRRPVVTYVLIALNVAIFLYELSLGPRLESFILEWGLVPARLSLSDPASFLTILTSMFLHSGWAHVGGNLLYLWIFGDNVEDRLGHAKFAFFYLATGFCAAMAQVLSGPGSHVPMIGASGAIAGVLGCYLLYFHHARVVTLVPIVFFLQLVEIPAIVFLGLWFLMQLFQGVASLHGAGEVTGGVAWWAHAGGFASGLLLGFVLGRRAAPPARMPSRRVPAWPRQEGGTPWARD